MATSTKTSLTAKERIFVAEYLKDRNSSRAAKSAGYKSPAIQGPQILRRPRVASLLMKEEKKACKRAGIDANEVLMRLAAVVNRDIADYLTDDGRLVNPKSLPRHLSSLIDSYETDEYYDEEGVMHVKKKMKFPPLLPALDLAMKHKGLFAAEKHEHSVKRTIDWEPYYKQQVAADPIQRRLEMAERGEEFVPEDEPIEAEYSLKSLIDDEED